MGFADLKKQSSLGSLTQKLVKEVEKQNGGGGGQDDRLWKPEMDKSGNGYAVIRFLPAPEGEDLPWVKLFSHAFQGPGGWYIENSLTTIGGKDPIGELNRELWNSGNEADKETVRKQKRKLSFYANIYVVKDPANPGNEGKVFLYKFGKKIFDKIMEAIWKKQYSLTAFTAPDQFKSYDELKKRLDYVLGNKSTRRSTVEEETEYDNYAATERKTISEEEITKKLEDSYQSSKASDDFNAPDITVSKGDDEDDPMSYFSKLAES